MSSNKSGYEIRSEVLKVAAGICQSKYKNQPDLLTEDRIIETAKALYTFVLDKGVSNGSK
tara:strand:- start:1850 stop:2029 length:180 start_codon:yes stop_codon:yes gene_type:complete